MLLSLIAFAGVAALLIIMPGPDSMLVLRNAVQSGRRNGAFTAAGTLTGLIVWAALASLGLAAVLAASPVAYEIVTVAGALYLVWMGVSGLLAARRAAAPAPAPDQPASQEPALDHRGPARSYLIGAVTNLLNPKVGIFFMSFLPGFVPAGKPVGAVSVLLGALFVAETAIWLGFVLVAAATISGWLRRPAVRKRFEQITSLVLVGFGIRVILSQ